MRKLLLTILSLVALAPGCAENEESLIVLDAPAWKDGECSVDPSSAEFLPFGVLDLSSDPVTGYVMPAILLNNARAQQSNKTNSGIVSNEIQLTGADVSLSSPQDKTLVGTLEKGLRTFNSPLPTISLMPQQTAAVVVDVIPSVTAQALAPKIAADQVVTIVASVVFRASRSGNVIGKVGAIEAREFEFPIRLCKGCLRTCVDCPGARCPVNNNDWVGGVCGNWQDLPIVPPSCIVGG